MDFKQIAFILTKDDNGVFVLWKTSQNSLLQKKNEKWCAPTGKDIVYMASLEKSIRNAFEEMVKSVPNGTKQQITFEWRLK